MAEIENKEMNDVEKIDEPSTGPNYGFEFDKTATEKKVKDKKSEPAPPSTDATAETASPPKKSKTAVSASSFNQKSTGTSGLNVNKKVPSAIQTYHFSDEQKMELVQRFILIRNRLVVQTGDPNLTRNFNLEFLQSFFEIPGSMRNEDDVIAALGPDHHAKEYLDLFACEYLHFIRTNQLSIVEFSPAKLQQSN